MKKRKYRLILILSAVPLLLALLCLSACASDPQVAWDEIFIQELEPSPEIMKALSGAAQDINLTSTRDDVTVHVKQTLGDAKTLYIALDVTLPDDIDFDAFSYTAGEPYLLSWLSPNVCEFVLGEVEYNDIKDLSDVQIENIYGRRGSKSAIPRDLVDFGLEVVKKDTQNNTVSCLISINSAKKFFAKDAVTLIIGDFAVTKDDEILKTYPGVHAISWTPENDSPFVERTIIDQDNKIVGSILLSPFSFTGQLYSSDFENFDDFYQSIKFLQKGGMEFIPEKRPLHITGGLTLPDGNVSQSYLFNHPVDINTIGKIQIGDFTVDVQAK